MFLLYWKSTTFKCGKIWYNANTLYLCVEYDKHITFIILFVYYIGCTSPENTYRHSMDYVNVNICKKEQTNELPTLNDVSLNNSIKMKCLHESM